MCTLLSLGRAICTVALAVSVHIVFLSYFFLSYGIFSFLLYQISRIQLLQLKFSADIGNKRKFNDYEQRNQSDKEISQNRKACRKSEHYRTLREIGNCNQEGIQNRRKDFILITCLKCKHVTDAESVKDYHDDG